jgi:sulfonate transport system ATP-binding protein
VSAVRLTGLRRAFGDRQVLAGVDLAIEAGEFVALLGRSGTGKSTLLRVLAGLDHGHDGEVRVPPKVSVVFQDARLLPWQRVRANVTLGLRRATGRPRREVVAMGLQALQEVGLEDHARAWPATLSGGEAQRAALARALVREPQLLLLDEPFGALDALTRTRMHGLLRQLCERHRPAVLLVTHDVDEALLLADRVLVLDEGHLTTDVVVDVPAPRRRTDPRFDELRAGLLAALHVGEPLLVPARAADGGRRGGCPPRPTPASG